MSREVTITFDLDRLEKFGDPEQTVQDFVADMVRHAEAGGGEAWMLNGSKVGKIVDSRARSTTVRTVS